MCFNKKVYTLSMRQIGIKYLQKNLSNELESLPFEIIRYGKVIAIVNDAENKEPEPKEKEFEKVIEETKDKVKEYKKQIVKLSKPEKIRKAPGGFNICPKHKGFYFSCGCQPPIAKKN